MRHGFLLIDKPRGPTSHDVVGMLRKSLHERDIGHLGTLDPLADGLMVLAVGSKGLKVVELFVGLEKEYLAVIKLGAVSTTYDAEGVIETIPRKAGWEPPVDASKIQALIDDHFIGKISQVPPAYSAVHVGGERAYKKAMRGENVEMKAREITIKECKVVDYAFPLVTLRVLCDSGTYIRSLAHDLGQTMRCGGYLQSLRRTKVGGWKVENAKAPDKAVWADVLPLKDILTSMPAMKLTPEQWGEFKHGRSIPGTCELNTIAWFEDLPVALLERSRKKEGMLKPRKVF
jgi:tRNA pseudouridine55 synthase